MALSRTSSCQAAPVRMEVRDGSLALVTLDDPKSRASILNQTIVHEFESVLAVARERLGCKRIAN